VFRKREAEAYMAALADSEATQSAWLLDSIVAPNVDSAFGRTHDFGAIRTVDDFRRAVPIRDYEGFRDDVERIDRGEAAVLTTEPTKRFFTTSGSTARPKYIPVTQSFIRDKSRAFGIFWDLVFSQHPGVAKGRMVTNFSDAGRPEPSAGGLPTSSESAYWASVTAATQRKKPVVPRAVSKIADHDARYYAIARVLLEREFTAIMALNPSTILLLFKTLEDQLDRLLADVENGTLSDVYSIDDEARAAVLEAIAPNPARAKELRGLLAADFPRLPAAKAFPALELAVSWRSPMLAPYLERLEPHLGGVAVRDYVSMASEGILAIPLADGESGGALGVGICFYELRPEDSTETILPHEAEVGGEYVVVLTNRAGLYRYDIGDVVRVKRFEGTTPVVEFLHRTGRTSSLTGEKLTEAQVTAAATEILDNQHVESFTLAPVVDGELPHYVLLVETRGTADRSMLQHAAATLDAAIGKYNGEYAGKRKSRRLGAPEVWQVASGSYAALKAEKIAAGGADLQYKHVHLTRDAAFVGRFEITERFRGTD
jgi:hypothetical protein